MSHARLSCSDSKAWIACPAKIRMAEGLPDQSSGAAAMAGTILHSEFERISLGGERALCPGAESELEELDYSHTWAINQLVTALDANDRYLATNDIEQASVMYEVCVNPGALIGRSDLWGTADVVAIDRSGTNLHVVDLKTGRWAVDPVGNSQLGLYGAGALHAIGKEAAARIKRIHLGIIQPEVSKDVISWSCSKRELIDFIEGPVAMAARLSTYPSTQPIPGEQCRFCRAKPRCPVAI